MYDLSPLLDVSPATDVPPGTSLLVAGPAMTGKHEFTASVLEAGLRNGDGAVAITTEDPASAVISGFDERVPDLPHANLCVLDTRAVGDREEHETPDGAFCHHVSTPEDLTGMGIGITRCFERLAAADVDRARLSLNTLSTMLTYTDRQTVFKFCHVVSSRLDGAGFLGLFTIDAAAHDDQTLQVIKQAVDGLVEIRRVDGRREARLSGLSPDPSPWVAL